MLKMITLCVAALCLCLSLATSAGQLAVKADAPKSYLVKEGDTLWHIAGLYLEHPWLWPQLWQVNPQVQNPHLIYPGDRLTLSYDANGRPQLALNQSGIRLSPDTSGPVAARDVRAAVQKLNPRSRQTNKVSQAVTTLPLSMIRPFLTYEQALSQEKIDALPYVLGADEQIKNANDNHLLYVKGMLNPQTGYGIYRQGKAYLDPNSQALLGYETILVATARVLRAGDGLAEPATVQIIDIKQEIKQGDKLLPAAEGQSLPAFFTMRAPELPIEGSIIDTTADLREFSSWDIVVLNRGEQDQIKPGHMFAIYRQSPTVVDSPQGPVYLSDASKYQKLTGGINGAVLAMPKEKVGQLMVFKVAELSSFAIVTSTVKPIRVGDMIGDL